MKKYQGPKMDFVNFSANDVIAASENFDNNIDELPDDEW